jgi:hypothetical protein
LAKCEPLHKPTPQRDDIAKSNPVSNREAFMNCSLDHVRNLILWALLCLGVAIALAALWVSAWSLFPAAVLVAAVSYYFIPAIKQALLDYITCRGPSKCNLATIGIDTLGQAAAILSAVSFFAAGVMEIAALAFLYSWFLAWLGVSIQAAVSYLVYAGISACVVVIGILLGVLSNAYGYKSCVDGQDTGPVVLQ